MQKTILITGATDGIGYATAMRLAERGHRILVHGRNPAKLADTATAVSAQPGAGPVEAHCADLSDLTEVARLGRVVATASDGIDAVINNAGVFKVAQPRTPDGMDVRFVVNTLAPALLTRTLLPVFTPSARAIHLSSAAQAPVDVSALEGRTSLDAMEAYAQSKLALTIWSQEFAKERAVSGPLSIAVNPGSLLATKMVKSGFGVAGNDIGIGADILTRAAISEEFAQASGQYFDNDSGDFATPHPQSTEPKEVALIVQSIEALISPYLG